MCRSSFYRVIRRSFWFKLRLDYPSLDVDADYDVLPPHYRPFIAAMITDWRGHRLFGRPEAPPYNNEDLRGRDCFIIIAADEFLNTKSEHEHALSVWCPRKDMAAGRFDREDSSCVIRTAEPGARS